MEIIMDKVEYSMWAALMQYRDHIVDKGSEAWRSGDDHEALMEKMCIEANVEPYIVFEHFKECARILSTPTVTITN
jgi:hypothetical protein